MAGMAELILEARAAGATFKISGEDIIVDGAAAISPEVREALKARRDEMVAHISGASPSSATLLRDAEVCIAYLVEDGAAREALAEILADAGDGPVGLDVETAAHPEFMKTSNVRLTKHGVSVGAIEDGAKGAALDPYRSEIRLVQVYGGGERCAVFDMRKVAWSVLAPLWQHHLVAHNLQFELKFLKSLGIQPENAECTLQAAGLLLGVHRRGLAVAAREYLGWDMPKDFQKSDWGVPALSEDQVAYAALDAVAALLLWRRLEADLHTKGRWEAYVLQRDAILAAVELEMAGIAVDTEALGDVIAEWSRKLSEARSLWQEETGTPPPEKPNQVTQWLSDNLDTETLSGWPTTKVNCQLSTSASSLERAAHHPAIRPLLEIKRLEKLLSSFGPSLRDKVSPVTGRIHANYSVAGTKSGRWSCRNPNLQQMPSERLAPGFRAIFKSPPGRVLIGADYSQMELRAVAEISGDSSLRQVYEDGLDLHSITAAAMTGSTPDEVTREQRNRAKPVNFGSIYGMGAAGLAAAAWNGYRVKMTLAEACRALDAFFRKFPRLKTWMRDNAHRSKQRHRINIGAGRVLQSAWEPKGIRYTQCCNLPVQGACADAMMRAVARIHCRTHAEGVDAVLVAQIHDEVIVETATELSAQVQQILEEEMVAAFLETFPSAPVTGLVDV